MSVLSLKIYFFVFTLTLFLLPQATLAIPSNCNPTQPTITVTDFTAKQPNKDPVPRTLTMSTGNPGTIVNIFGAGAVKVKVDGPTDSCYFKSIIPNITACSMKMTEVKDNKVIATSTTYFSKPTSKTFWLMPKSVLSNIKLKFNCGTIRSQYTLGTLPCERPFSEIIKDLNDNKHTIITEDSFKDWAKDDGFDHCIYNGKCTKFYSYPSGSGFNPLNWFNSGDKGDIVENINKGQSCSAIQSPSVSSVTQAISQMKKWTDLHRPIILSMVLVSLDEQGDVVTYTNDYYGANFGHQVIVLKVEKGSIDDYNIEILNPNGPRIETLNCQKRRYRDSKLGLIMIYVCDNNDFSNNNYYYIPVVVSDVSSLVTNLTNFCRANSQSKFCQERYANTTGWLKSNYPDISNPSGPDGNGACSGWSDFILKVTYLGEFGYECPRTGGGSASTLKSIQLANIQEAINQIAEQINNLKAGLLKN